MTDTMQEAQHRNSELLSAIKTAGEAALRLYAENDALAARLAEVERDAARYRWLRSQDPLQSYCPMCTYDGLRLIVGEALDRAVDNGMKAQP